MALDSSSASAVTTAMTPSLKMMESRYGSLRLDSPLLIHALANPSSYDYAACDHWVATAHDAAGKTRVIFDFVYNPSKMSMRFASADMLTTDDPRAAQFPVLSLTDAEGLLKSERHVDARQGAAAALAFLSLPDDYIGPLATKHWTGGGTAPADPIWHIVANDGHDYYVGTDRKVYTRADLPLA